MSEDGTTVAAVGLRAPTAAGGTRNEGRCVTRCWRLTTDYSRLTPDP